MKFPKAPEALVWISGEEPTPSGPQQPRCKPTTVHRTKGSVVRDAQARCFPRGAGGIPPSLTDQQSIRLDCGFYSCFGGPTSVFGGDILLPPLDGLRQTPPQPGGGPAERPSKCQQLSPGQVSTVCTLRRPDGKVRRVNGQERERSRLRSTGADFQGRGGSRSLTHTWQEERIYF